MTKSQQIAYLRAAKERAVKLWPDPYCIRTAMFGEGIAWTKNWTFDGCKEHGIATHMWVRNRHLSDVIALFDNSIDAIEHGKPWWER